MVYFYRVNNPHQQVQYPFLGIASVLRKKNASTKLITENSQLSCICHAFLGRCFFKNPHSRTLICSILRFIRLQLIQGGASKNASSFFHSVRCNIPQKYVVLVYDYVTSVQAILQCCRGTCRHGEKLEWLNSIVLHELMGD